MCTCQCKSKPQDYDVCSCGHNRCQHVTTCIATLNCGCKHYSKSRDCECQCEEWPKIGDEYWCVDSCGNKYTRHYDDTKVNNFRLKTGNFFRTEAELDRYILRLESMKPTFKPKVGEEYWTMFLEGGMPCVDIWRGTPIDWLWYRSGRVFRTKAECQAWFSKYGDVWFKE